LSWEAIKSLSIVLSLRFWGEGGKVILVLSLLAHAQCRGKLVQLEAVKLLNLALYAFSISGHTQYGQIWVPSRLPFRSLNKTRSAAQTHLQLGIHYLKHPKTPSP